MILFRSVGKALVLVWVLFTACPAFPEIDLSADGWSGKPIARIEIRIDGQENAQAKWERVAKDLMGIKEGDLYSSERLFQTIEILNESSLFRQIHVEDPILTEKGVKLSFLLSPFARVEKIRISGAFPLFKKEVLNVMTLSSGSPFTTSLLDEQIPRITSLMEKEGYIDPKVTLSALKNSKNGQFTVDIKIKKQEYFRINQIVFKGNRAISSSVLRRKIKTGKWRAAPIAGRRYVSRELKKDEKAMLDFYRKNGYLEAMVEAVASKDIEKERVDVSFEIDEGPLITILYEGNRQYNKKALNRSLFNADGRSPPPFRIKKTLRDLKNFYLKNGYADVKLSHTVETKEKDGFPLKEITFNISEGDRYVISSLDISGNHSLEKKQILGQVLSASNGLMAENGFSRKKLDADVYAIKALYLKEGYSKTAVQKKVDISRPDIKEKTRTKTVRIHLMVDEGPRTLVGSMAFRGINPPEIETVSGLMSLKPGEPFREYMLKSDENLLKEHFSEKGYPHVTVSSQVVFNAEDTLADLIYEIDSGPHVKTGQIFFVGNFRTRSSVLLDEVDINTGESFSLKKLLKSNRDLMNLNALDSARVKTPGLKEKREEVDLIFEVEEKKPYSIELGTGYDTQRNLYAEFTAGDHNFSGRNLHLEGHSEISRIGYSSELSLMNPRLFSSQLESSTRIFIEKSEEFNKSFGNRTYGISQEIHRSIAQKRLTVKIGGTYKSHELYATDAVDTPGEDPERYSSRDILSLSHSLILRTTDAYVSPRKGTFSTVQVDLSKGLDSSQDDFIKYRLDTRWFYSPLKSITFALRGRYSLIQPYAHNESVPEDQLFFLGGTSSVRGFEENLLRADAFGNALGGREQMMGSVEARYNIFSNWEFNLFYDIGAIKQAEREFGSENFRSSVGVGIRYMTPIGPVGLLYGRKLDPLDNESSGCFHFSMGYTF